MEGWGLPLRVLVIRGDDGKFHAFHNRCTHIGHRRLDPVSGTGTVQCCSVGKSTYTYDGKKVYGPPSGHIKTFTVAVNFLNFEDVKGFTDDNQLYPSLP